jgi:RNA polymerase sigma-70 factor (ECF subfamily)
MTAAAYAAGYRSGIRQHDERSTALASSAELDRFLAGVERRAFVIARMAVGHDQDALDVVQDAMMKLAQNYSKRDPAEWPPLFHRILQSKIRDWYRRTAIRTRWRGWLPALRTGDAPEDQPDPMMSAPDVRAVDPADAVATRRVMARLELAVANLPRRQQQAFLLRTWEGLDVADTARAMGCSEGSVKTHYSRALQSLRKQIDPEREV